ncbi:DUF4439 domain-containing protein [Cellulomonas edaphi]|uniref:DUF4439 domain-containing protein n=1 Tax=Cellulomonas edaphi TaxID=3053468 RepID=A0ABT7SAS2_9CELL|nr:DUF4439 domain-containing protein [Cellulomons edaphi]MDM7832718.1 DUF4439 domain-containing protein [Cellulomons edaphi]
MSLLRTSPFPHDDRLRPPARAVRHVARITAAALAVALLGACSVRLEGPPQVEPSPGAVEQVRARTLADAAALEDAARAALATAPPATVAAVLDDVADFSEQHALQLGPAYDSGLSPSPTATPAPVVAEPADVLAELADATRTALIDADSTDDADLARLVASIGTAREQLTRRLARATGVRSPAVQPVRASEPVPSPAASDPAPGPAAEDLAALVVAHDQAGYAYEVIAAKQPGAVRDKARAAAAAHRDQAQRWAVVAGTAQSADDPRRVAYDVPDGLGSTATARRLAVSLESAVAEANATLVGRTPAGERATFVDGLRAATSAARPWGAAPVAFPGLPERAEG